jgi:hypothetical protein
MMQKTIVMARRKNIALVAHDNKKEELVEWAKLHCKLLGEHSLYATRTTGRLLENRLGLKVTLLESGPLGGWRNAIGDALDDHPHPGRNTSAGLASFAKICPNSKLCVVHQRICSGRVAAQGRRQKNFVTIVTSLCLSQACHGHR